MKTATQIKKTAFVRVRIEPEIKEEAEKILHDLGISASQAVNMLYRHISLEHKWPIELKIPNESTKQTFLETDKGVNLVKCKNTKELFKSLGI